MAELAEGAPQPIEYDQANAEDPFTIAGSHLALTRMFENLFENARRYGDGWVGVSLHRDAAGLRIALEDNGRGLPETELERVIAPFVRGEASRNKTTGGTGLGLGSARAIAQTHGAEIRLSKARRNADPSRAIRGVYESPMRSYTQARFGRKRCSQAT